MTTRYGSIASGVLFSLMAASSALAAGTLDNEPMVIYDLSGNGIAGPIHEHLAVYSSGLASRSSFEPGEELAAQPSNPEVEVANVGVSRVGRLVAALVEAGAMTMTDLPQAGSGLPIKTVTVFGGPGEQAPHNTFSFHDPNDPRVSDIVAALYAFMYVAFTESGVSPIAAPIDPPVAIRIPLRFGDERLLPAVDLGLRFVDVPRDSRCPIDVNCPWTGEIEIVLNVWHHSTDRGEIHLTYSPGAGSSVIVASGYEIEILDVWPQARSDSPIQLEEYRILLQITEPR